MKKINLFLAFIIIMSISSVTLIALGNGSPIDFSSIARTGNIKLIPKTSISIEQENLSIKFYDDYADVQVKYYIFNNGKDDSVSFGFPVDYLLEGIYFEEIEQELKKDDEIKNFEIYDGDKKLNAIESKETEELAVKGYTGAESFKAKRQWFVTDINLLANKNKIITIKYKIKCQLDDWFYGDELFPTFSDRYFIYTFSPAGNWGDGTIKKFNLEIDFTQNLKKGAKIKSINLKGYIYNNGKYSYQTENFKPAQAEDLIIKYDNSPYNLTQSLKDYRIKKENIVYIKASSTFGPKYSVKNLLDGKLETAWVEGATGYGKGEWIEMEIENFMLTGILIVNGYTKNKNTFYNNGQVYKMKVNINNDDLNETKIIEIKPRKYTELNKMSFAPFMDTLASFYPGYIYSAKIRLTIADVIKGNKYSDTAISELILWGQRQ